MDPQLALALVIVGIAVAFLGREAWRRARRRPAVGDQTFIRHCTGDNVRVLVDLSRVSYLSPIGIPMLINTARSVFNSGGRMVLLSPQKNVADVLTMTGIHLIVPIFDDLASARAGLLTS